MARKKNNKKEQTFNVYPYLGQYQYLMRTGGQLPWYQDKGPVETKRTYTLDGVDYDTYEEFAEAWKKKTPNITVPPKEHLDKQFDGNNKKDEGEPTNEEDPIVDSSCSEEAADACNKKGGTFKEEIITETGKGTRTVCNCVMPEEESQDENLESPCSEEDMAACREKGGTIQVDYTTTPPSCNCKEGSEDDDKEEKGDCPDAIYKKCALESKAVDPKTCECIEKIDDKNETPDSVKQQAIEDYQNGKISKKEMEDIVYSHNLGDGPRKGKPDFELSPTSKLGLFADALSSTANLKLGRQSINPKTGKPYTAADFKQTTIDMGKVSNVNDAQLYWDDANLKKFLEEGEGYKDMNVSDLLGTSTMHSSRRFDDFQEHQQNLLNEYVKSGDLESAENVISKRSMDRVTGDISYDDVSETIQEQTRNPAYIEAIQLIPKNEELEGHPSLEGIDEFITTDKVITREHTDDDLTSFDKARDNTKNYSTTDLLINKEADVTGLVRTGPQAEPNVIGPKGGTNLQIEDYDENRSYEDNIEIKKETDEQRKKREREGNNEEENIEDGKKVVSEVENEDGSITITYADGTTKTVKRESNQERKNKERKEKNEGKMGLEMFVYGGQPKKLDKYQWRGEKVHDFLKYHPDFPRTSHVPYTGDFTADQLQNAITRDSTIIENSLDDSWFLRNLIGQDQTHQSNMGPAGKLQLNREWLHKLLMQDDQERAKKLNFYKDGGALPKYQDEKSETDENENKSDGPNDPPKDNNETPVVVEEVDVEGEINEDAENDENSDEENVDNLDGSPDGEGSLTEEEMTEMDETKMVDSDIVDSNYGNWWNKTKKATKTGVLDRAINTYGDVAGTVTKWADFGNAVLEGWQNDAAEARAWSEGTTGEDQFVTQESSQGIHDVNTGDSWTNQKVDEIYAGNTQKAPLIMQQGGNSQQMAQPVVDNINYAALAEFTGNSPWNTEIRYSPEVIAYQKQIMAKMAHGGQLPMAQDGWWDKMKTKAKKTWDETDFKTPINKALDYTQTTLSAAGLTPAIGIIPDAINTAISAGRTGHAVATGDDDAAKKYGTSLALNAASMVPVAGQAAGVTSLANDAVNYAAATQDKATPVTPPVQIADKTTVKDIKEDVKIDKVARHGGEQEVEVDYETLQELIKAGADIEIL